MGEITFPMFYNKLTAQEQVRTDYLNRTKRNFQIVVPTTTPVTVAFTATVTGFEFDEPVDGALTESAEFQTVLVVASFDVKRHAEDQRITGWLRRMARFGVELGAIETGSEILAAAGLLDSHQAAVHWDNIDGFRERYPGVEALTQLYTFGRGRMTCAGDQRPARPFCVS